MMNKRANHFRSAMLAIALSVFVFSAAFFTEEGTTAFVTLEQPGPSYVIEQHSLNQLSPGNYYVDFNGVIYWIDDSQRPAVAKLNNYKYAAGRQFYISKDGDVRFV